ncbi:hypothetical protein OUZ56_028922 [Daphnia magna]|uniref:Uncharacterized protein n=2 Tax=Daphnia magna TaxID=35525 RepID=A0ABR0B5B1_9CRUS|nr:hypothetical protein OUZ56_028920 [Daphnia magna]KAK4036884.1 hypothetical protein OUZ56_028922 [Daphnia magna]
MLETWFHSTSSLQTTETDLVIQPLESVAIVPEEIPPAIMDMLPQISIADLGTTSLPVFTAAPEIFNRPTPFTRKFYLFTSFFWSSFYIELSCSVAYFCFTCLILLSIIAI